MVEVRRAAVAGLAVALAVGTLVFAVVTGGGRARHEAARLADSGGGLPPRMVVLADTAGGMPGGKL